MMPAARQSQGLPAPYQFLVLDAGVEVVSHRVLEARFQPHAVVFVIGVPLEGEELQVEPHAGSEAEPGEKEAAHLQEIRVPFQLGAVRYLPVHEEEGIWLVLMEVLLDVEAQPPIEGGARGPEMR